MNAEFSRKKQQMGLLFGVIAGTAFSITAWGIDALQLALAHATYPLIKFLPGFLLCVLAGGMVGWLTVRIERLWASLILWALLAWFFAWLVLWLPLNSTPALLSLLEPSLAKLIYYPAIDSQTQFSGMALVVIGFVSLLCGLMENHLIDQAMLGQGSLATISPILISLVVFGLAGTSADYLLNRHFRGSMQAIDGLIQFAVDHEGQDVPLLQARQKRLSVVRDLDEILTYPRELTLIAYDKALGQMDFLVDFSGNWVRCTVIYDQPTMCKRIMVDALRFACEESSKTNSCFNSVVHKKNLTNNAKF